ncbi:AMP phosphorylase [Candidatus Woesearchaeota archaeon]|nr:AMP phosphorylase [Candidatus Woesearchaeota archaeon]
MKLIAKDMDIATGDVLVAILNQKDAAKMDLHALDRIKIKKSEKIETVVLDIAESEKAVPEGHIGVFEEVIDSLGLKDNEPIEVIPARKPLSIDFIKKKLDGGTLDKKEIDQIVWDIVHNKLDAIELTYFVSACYSNRMTMKETALLTKAMSDIGDKLKLRRYPVMDKHCSGGVAGNRTTMIIVPIIAAAGLTIPKTSSRSITSPAGTADTVEVLTNVNIPLPKMKKIVEKTNGCLVWGGALNLAPADDKIIKVEKPLAIDAKSQLLASVMAKKASVSATHVLIDIPYGKGSKILDKKAASQLKKGFEELAKALGMIVKVILTDGTQPIGNGIGPSLEARDVLWILRNDPRGPQDLRRKALMMAGLMLEMGYKAKKGEGLKKAAGILNDGRAYKKFIEIIKAQGGKEIMPQDIKIGEFAYNALSPKQGIVRHVDNHSISKIARIAGAPQNKGAGVYLYKHVGDKVNKDESLFTIYAESQRKLDYAVSAIEEFDGIVVG